MTEFKGFVLGEKLDIARAQQDLALKCVPPAQLRDDILCMGATTIAGAAASEVLLSISRDGRLMSLTMSCRHEDFVQISEALREKYGRPTTDQKSSGRPYLAWSRPDGGEVTASDAGANLMVSFRGRRADAQGNPKQDL